MGRPIPIMVLFSLMVFCAASVFAEESTATRAGCTSLSLTAQPASGAPPHGRFSASKTLNIVFEATYALAGQPEVRGLGTLTFRTPGGFIYQQMEVPFRWHASGEGVEESLRIPGYPFPVTPAVTKKDAARGRPPVSTLLSLPPLLVGGTAIQHGGLFGKWTAEFRPLDGSRSCSAKFFITP